MQCILNTGYQFSLTLNDTLVIERFFLGLLHQKYFLKFDDKRVITGDTMDDINKEDV
jgi:hypothetical protein